MVIWLKLIKSSFRKVFESPPCVHELDDWDVSTDRFSHRCAIILRVELHRVYDVRIQDGDFQHVMHCRRQVAL